jgi:hypothetical protein
VHKERQSRNKKPSTPKSNFETLKRVGRRGEEEKVIVFSSKKTKQKSFLPSVKCQEKTIQFIGFFCSYFRLQKKELLLVAFFSSTNSTN